MTSEDVTAYSGPFGRRYAIALIFAFLALRLILSATMPLIADEAYAVVASRVPTLSYFDHPPLAFDLARLSAWLFGSEASFVVRLPYVLLGSASAWLIYLLTRRAFGAEAAFWALGAYSVAPFFLVSAGHFVVPDGPLNFFLLLTLWFVLPELLGQKRPNAGRWTMAGFAFGLALLSKYTAVLFGVSALALLVALPSGRRALASPGPWLALLVAFGCTAPIIFWNIQNDWVSLSFQGNRAAGGALSPLNLVGVLAGNAAYLLPWTWALAVFAIASAFLRPRLLAERIFATLAALPIVVFTAVSLFSRELLPHWAMPGYLFAFPLVGLWCERIRRAAPRLATLTLALSGAAVALLAALTVSQTNAALLTRAFGLSSQSDFDWTILSMNRLAEDFRRRGISDDPGAFLVTPSWVVAGKAGYDIGPELPLAPPLVDGRHLSIVRDPRAAPRDRGYAVLPVRVGTVEEGKAELAGLLAGRYHPTDEPWVVTQDRAGIPAFEIIVVPVARQ